MNAICLLQNNSSPLALSKISSLFIRYFNLFLKKKLYKKVAYRAEL